LYITAKTAEDKLKEAQATAATKGKALTQRQINTDGKLTEKESADLKSKTDQYNGFVASLTDNEKTKFKIAQDYYDNELALDPKLEALLKKKDITNQEARNVLTNYINSKMK